MAKIRYEGTEGTRYEGTYNFRGVEVPLVVSFTASAVREYNEPGNPKEKVDLKDFYFIRNCGQPMEILPLVKGDGESEQLLWQTLDPQNPEVSTSGDGQHATKVRLKIEKWGTREGVQKCLILKSGGGYYNLGSSEFIEQQSRLVDTHGMKAEKPLEAGLLQSAEGNPEDLSALVASVHCYTHYLYSRATNFFDSGKVIYTVSPKSEATIACLEAGGFYPWSSALQSQLVKISNDRLKIENGTVLERQGGNFVPKVCLVHEFNQAPGSMSMSMVMEDAQVEAAGASAGFDDAA